MAKEPMSKRLYKNSPKLESDENGKKVIRKPAPSEDSKTAARTNDGTEGEPVHESHDKAVMDLHATHMKERLALHHKHEKAHLELMQKSAKGADGEEMINKVENNEKE